MKTLEEFSASRTDTADIGKAIGADMYNCGEPIPGYLYLDVLYIERMDDGRLCLTLGRSETIEDDNAEGRARLEGILYDWAIAEGYASS